MTFDEIQSAMTDLVAKMAEKGIKMPNAEMQISHRPHVCLSGSDRPFKRGSDNYAFIYGDTPQSMIADAHEFIDALPSPATEGARKYTRALADAIDIATEYSLPDAAVAPVRAAIVEVNAVLLEAPK